MRPLDDASLPVGSTSNLTLAAGTAMSNRAANKRGCRGQRCSHARPRRPLNAARRPVPSDTSMFTELRADTDHFTPGSEGANL